MKFTTVMLVLVVSLCVLWLATMSYGPAVAPAGVPFGPAPQPVDTSMWKTPLQWIVAPDEVLVMADVQAHTIELLHVPRPLAGGARWRLVYGDRAVTLDELGAWVTKEGGAK